MTINEENNPWKKVCSKKVYDNPWITLTEDKVITPGGTDGIYGTVSFKNLAVGIIPIDKEGYTYLVGQYRYPLNEYSWEIPMGGGLLNDTPLDSAKRELKEETGLTANTWDELLKIHTSNAVTDETGYIFIAQDLEQGESEPEDTEELQVKKVSLKEAYNMAMEGKITDSLSLAGILKAWIVYGN